MENEFIHINLYQCAKSFRTPERILDCHYLLFVHSGKGYFHINGEKLKAESGDLFFCKKFCPNVIVADDDDPFLLSGLEFKVDDDAYLEKSIEKKYNISNDPFLLALLKEMVEESSQGKCLSKQICSSLLQGLLFKLIRISQIGSTAPSDQSKSEILKYIQSNFHRDLSHEKLQKHFAYHKNSINNYLKKTTGLSLKGYVTELRMKYACELLSYSDLSVLEISQKCGYHYESFFSRQFKHRFGISPYHYRSKRSL